MSGDGSIDKSALYGAAAGTGGAVGGLFNTEQGGKGGAPGSGGVSGGDLDPSSSSVDLDALAQKELLEATRAIEAIALELASRQRKVQEGTPAAAPDAPLTWDHVSDAILDGTQVSKRMINSLKITIKFKSE